MTERFFILTPTPTSKTHEHCAIYLDASGMEMRWSAKFPIPAIGQRIFITLNGIGWAVVKGYFVSETSYANYVGVMTLPTNPPAWLKAQNRRDKKARENRNQPQWMIDGIGCEFGAEIELKRPKLVKKAVA